MRAATFAFGLAVVFGLVLGLLLTGTGPGASGIVGGQYWAIVLIAASVYLGWQVAQLSNAVIGLVAAPVLVVLMIAVLLVVKFVRVPWAPAVAARAHRRRSREDRTGAGGDRGRLHRRDVWVASVLGS